MGLPEDTLNIDLDSELRGLFREAECAIEQRTVPKPPESARVAESASSAERPAKTEALSLLQLLRPVVQGLEAVSRATSDNTALLKRLDTAATNAAAAHAAATANAANAAKTAAAKTAAAAKIAAASEGAPGVVAPVDLSQIVAELRGMLESKNGLNQSMFSALHEELKGYKDGFLLESVHRPIIRDLVSLHDDITGIQRQVTATLGDPDFQSATPLTVRVAERLRAIEMNLEHNLEFIAEVLNRLEVTLMDPHGGKLNKRTQRAVAVELAEDPEQEGEVIRVVKRGFLWKDRILRAEEVVIKKWQEGNLVAFRPDASK